MSAHPSKPLPFTCSIGVLGSRDAPKKLQCPRHLHVDFGAVFYASKEDRNTSPYVGTVDLEAHFVSLLSLNPGLPERTTKVPKFPGYQVPVRGQIQIVLKNSNQTAFKPFLIPYDLAGLERGDRGGRTFLRQKSYSVGDEGEGKGKLRFAVHLTFCSPPRRSKKERDREPKYYLYQSIRVVFAAQALDPTEKVRVVLEGPAELLYGSNGAPRDAEDVRARQTWRESQFGDYRGPGDEWELGRKELRVAATRRAEGGSIQSPFVSESAGGGGRGAEHRSDGDTIDTSQHTTIPEIPSVQTSSLFSPASIPPSDNAVPAPLRPHPLSISTTFSSPASPVFPPLHPAPAPLTFGRVPSPVSTDLVRGISRDRKQSVVSGLSLSRPNSPASFSLAPGDRPDGPSGEVTRKAGSREREMCGR
ncbi:hypothetical protein JCM11491_005810 [Sporobolomyces phaffii]